MKEDEILSAAMLGDKKAFEQIVAIYQKDLYYTALGVVRSGWDALDICQDTFLKAFTSLKTLKDASKLKAWLCRILINRCNDLFRQRKKVEAVDYIELKGFFNDPSEESLDLMKALSSLSNEHRVALSLRYFQDLPIRDIASITGCPEGTVKSRISNGLKELRKLLEPDFAEASSVKEDVK